MKKRTMNEIEKDYKRIRAFVDANPVTSIKELAQELSLSNYEVRTSLARHPLIKEKILAQLEQNRNELKAKKKAEKQAEKTVYTVDFDQEFVIDASITGIEELEDILSKLCVPKVKIILTSITIRELENMQRFNDVDGCSARHILAMAVENQESFHTVLIDESIGTPDDCIIKYCADHKDNVTLLTSDKTMVLKAKMYGVQTQYFKQKRTTHPVATTTTQPMTYSYNKTNHTLFTARKVGNKLFITDFNTPYRSIMVISNGIEYTEGVYELKIGDDVYLATKKPKYMTFAHYQITFLTAENNCKLIYSARIYNAKEIRTLAKSEYKSFIRDFKCRRDL